MKKLTSIINDQPENPQLYSKFIYYATHILMCINNTTNPSIGKIDVCSLIETYKTITYFYENKYSIPDILGFIRMISTIDNDDEIPNYYELKLSTKIDIFKKLDNQYREKFIECIIKDKHFDVLTAIIDNLRFSEIIFIETNYKPHIDIHLIKQLESKKTVLCPNSTNNSNSELTYFIKMDNMVKIGKSIHPEKRLKALQTNNPSKLILLYTTNKFNESEIHNKFYEYRTQGEWYQFSDEIKQFIDQLKIEDEKQTKSMSNPYKEESYLYKKESYNNEEIVNQHGWKVNPYKEEMHEIQFINELNQLKTQIRAETIKNQ